MQQLDPQDCDACVITCAHTYARKATVVPTGPCMGLGVTWAHVLAMVFYLLGIRTKLPTLPLIASLAMSRTGHLDCYRLASNRQVTSPHQSSIMLLS